MILREILKTIRHIELRAERLVRWRTDSIASFSLAPGFSPVSGGRGDFNRFSGFLPPRKPLKRLECPCRDHTGLKPGANERPSASPLRQAAFHCAQLRNSQSAIRNRQSR